MYEKHIEDYKRELEQRRIAEDLERQGYIQKPEKEKAAAAGCLIAGVGLAVIGLILLYQKWKGII